MANGLYTNSELIDSIIVDLNNLLKSLFSGQYVGACSIITSMAKKLSNLRKTIDNDLRNREETIETLKQELRYAGRGVQDVKPSELVDKLNSGELQKDSAKVNLIDRSG